MGGQRRTIERLKQKQMRGRGKKLIVEVCKEVGKEIRRAARKEFPNEYLGFLIGHDLGEKVAIVDVWHSDYINSPEMIEEGAYYAAMADAREHARTVGGDVVGDVHSHAYKYDEACPVAMDCAPSEGDMKLGSDGLMAICMVRQEKNGRLTTKLNFYPPIAAVSEVYV